MYQVDVGTPGAPWSATAVQSATATSAAAVSASYAGAANRKATVTTFSAGSSASAWATIESPAGTVLWTEFVPAARTVAVSFDPPLVITTANQAVVVKVSPYAAAANVSVNAAGFSVYSG